ncbi:3-phosphoshikimate 1-carboxyvinyltransferase [Methanocorpusculum sp. MG]|uniref:3-phosphoshikimate 1-carboxyvinyltransferase n=1 Tax=Methanocorpusculum petauri TaxID=3002863 RepID=A0ABT4IEW1_9EURY|nr:3-phosphoshikimate 1-carboxyvinyltransferase [Methanocorpusculum petauri]MCZ0859894.1 3-phosphoshikimate 1-carboxyvinyltransferase [Methanocorpusculum petauri]MDE2443731.1 3-phosphoshikimate 1-carboxyvinyltransferase [Methanocorpusculum sp.]
MMLAVQKSTLRGTVAAPPSKSHTHRAFILAALADGESVVSSPLIGEDTCATLDAVAALGATVSRRGDDVVIRGGGLSAPADVINCKNSGTSIRILAGVAAQIAGTVSFTGDASLCSRPMKPLLDALAELGVTVSAADNGCAPFSVTGPATGCCATIRGDISSQFISALLIGAPLGGHGLTIHLTTPLTSRPYVEMTIAAMKKRGVAVVTTGDGFIVPEGRQYLPASVRVGGDYSSAAFLFAAGALAGDVCVTNLDPADPQGDKMFIGLLELLGAVVSRKPDGTVRVGHNELRAEDVNLADAPDLFPIAAVLSTQCSGTTRLYGAAHLRFKESDRIKSTALFLRDMGADITETEDGCIIRGPSTLHGAKVTTFGDHRIMMAAAVAGLIADGTTVIDDPGCCAVSYPAFVADMQALGADMRYL